MSKVHLIAALVLVVGTVVLGSARSQPGQSAPVAARDLMAVGTFKTEELVVAYYKSAVFSEKLKALVAERDGAARKGDSRKVRELEEKGEALQERAHQQYAGEAPLTEILEVLRPGFPEVAKAAGVGAIVADFVWKDPAFKTVDVTDRLVQRLAPRK
jgi:hypothetical protein